MTSVNERGAIEVCGRVIRLSGGRPRAVGNFNAGDIVAGIDAAGRAEAGFGAPVSGSNGSSATRRKAP